MLPWMDTSDYLSVLTATSLWLLCLDCAVRQLMYMLRDPSNDLLCTRPKNGTGFHALINELDDVRWGLLWYPAQPRADDQVLSFTCARDPLQQQWVASGMLMGCIYTRLHLQAC